MDKKVIYVKNVMIITLCVFFSSFLNAQEITGIQAEIRKMSKETDPVKSIAIKNQIIKDYKLDSLKDAETIDMLYSNIAISFARNKEYTEFEKQIGLIKNKFNQTSILNLAANILSDNDIDAVYANRIAKETIEKYDSFKDDPKAKPADYTKEDWERFMNFAKYPYYDTYAKTLFALKRYKEALEYQQKAFDGSPEDGFPPSVERYAKLLEMNGNKEGAEQLLLKIAGKGKLNNGMVAQLKSFYITERGTSAKFDAYLDSLQNGIHSELTKDFKAKMINETAPLFTLNDIDGKSVSLSDYKGKIVILDLWATWCAPCIKSFPAMQKLVEKYPDVVFLFIAVEEQGNDALKRVKGFMNKNKYPFHVLMDEPVAKGDKKNKITSSYRPDGIPAKYFIDKEGRLRFKTKGFDTDSELINETDAIISILKGL